MKYSRNFLSFTAGLILLVFVLAACGRRVFFLSLLNTPGIMYNSVTNCRRKVSIKQRDETTRTNL